MIRIRFLPGVTVGGIVIVRVYVAGLFELGPVMNNSPPEAAGALLNIPSRLMSIHIFIPPPPL